MREHKYVKARDFQIDGVENYVRSRPTRLLIPLGHSHMALICINLQQVKLIPATFNDL